MLKQIDIQTYDEFSKKMNQDHFLHSIKYLNAREKMGWVGEILGYYEDETLLAACILHKKKLPKINQWLFYIPRGMIIDYSNAKLLESFTSDIYNYVKENNGYSLRIDPELPAYIDGEVNPIVDVLTNCGYKHLGFVNNFEGTQPRCTIINNLANKSYEDVYNNYEKRAQRHIKNALNNGIEIVEGSVDDLDDFMQIMEDTATRGGYITRTREYFEILLSEFGDNMKMYFAQFNPQLVDLDTMEQDLKAIEAQLMEIHKELLSDELSKSREKKLKNEMKQKEQTRNKLLKNYELCLDITTNYPKGIKLATALYVKQGNKAWYWFGGSRSKYRELNPVYAMFDQYIQWLIANDVESFDFLGISGNINDPSDKNYGLYQFKKSFGGDVVEFVGEFDLIINKSVYKIANKILTIAQSSQKNPVLEKILKLVQ